MTTSNTEWLARAQVGMFYHFGLYTLLGGNENQVRKTEGKDSYRKLLDQFNPTRFNADEWVDCAVSMGARYIVPTAKHAEGFCLWDSKLTDLKSTNTPFGRDIIAELSAVCAKKGVQFCFYFNMETWLNDGNDIWNRQGMSYADFFEAQLTELLTGYGPVGLIWFDHEHPEIPYARFQKIIELIKRLQPDCLVNDRGVFRGDPLSGDFVTPERRIPGTTAANRYFIECCDAMGVDSWGYCKGGTFWSTSELAKRVSLCRSKGYNYLLNVEPAPDGTIRPECAIRARGLGDWIAKNKSAVDAGPCTLEPIDATPEHQPVVGAATLDGNTLYLHLHQWPVADDILVKAAGKPLAATFAGQNLTVSASEKGIRVVGLPADMPAGNAPWIIAVEFENAPTAFPPAPGKVIEIVAGESLALWPLDAELNSIHGVVFPKINRFANGNISVGSLHRIGDTVSWNALVPSDGDYEVYANFGAIESQSKAAFALTAGDSVLTGRCWLTGHYSEPVRKPIGRLRLSQGPNRIVLSITEAPKEAFPDVHGITLIPVAQ